MKRYRKQKIALFLTMLILLTGLPISSEQVQAGVWDNAYTYYQTYGNSVLFQPTSQTDGVIYYATKAATATTKTKFRTIGWKVTVKNLSGGTIQNLYFKLNGSYMQRVDVRKKSGYEYDLYALPLYQLKRRLNAKAEQAVKKGQADVVLNACMIVVSSGQAKGAMNDNGPTSGQVYTTYSGIAGAANWSNSAKQSFPSYFNKVVDGLFVLVKAGGDSGIASFSGEGYYCYGTYVTLRAKVKKGFEFEMWDGDVRSVRPEVSFYANEPGTWIAQTVRKWVTIIFHRNLTPQDAQVDWQKVSYGDTGEAFQNTGWRKNGEEMLGWALDSNADKAAYGTREKISNSWILKYSPQVHLYAVWPKDTDEATPDEAITDEATPDPMTPDEATPDPATPDEATPDEAITDEATPDPQAPESTITESVSSAAEGRTIIKKIHCRFISQKYFEDVYHNLIPEAEGGLPSDSRWVQIPSLRKMLRQCLQS